MARDRVERGLAVIELDPDRSLARRSGADLGDRRGVRFAQPRLDVQALVVPPHDVAEVGERDPRVLAKHLLDRDAEPFGARFHILELAVRRCVVGVRLGRSEMAQRIVQGTLRARPPR